MHEGSSDHKKREAVGESMRQAGLAAGNVGPVDNRPLAERQKDLLERLARHKSEQKAKHNLRAKQKRGSAIEKALNKHQ